jgi:predicted RNase H-like nuclease (RuvC/YqgF family)
LDAIGNAQGLVNQRNCPKQWVGFAIELETELQEATFEIERLRKANLQLREGAEQQKQHIKRFEEDLMDAKNKAAALVADVALYEDRGERIKRLEDIISRAAYAFYRDGSDGQVASGMLTILEEVRLK